MPKIDDALGLHEYALKLRAYRMELLSSNLANSDTPNYKARDIDFNQLLQNYQAQQAQQIKTTQQNHIGNSQQQKLEMDTQFRLPSQPSIDGNTVDSQVEKAAVMENSIHYQATLSFINSRISSIKKALRGD